VDRVNLRPHRHGRLATAIVAAVTAVAGGCTRPNPAFVGVDALGRPGGSGGSGGSPDGAGGGAGAAGGTGDGAPPSGDALPADEAPATADASPPDIAWTDLGAPADLPAPPPDTALPADATPPVDLPAADAARPATSRFNFETTNQGWGDLRPGTRDFPTTATRVTAPAPAWDGQWSLAIAMRSGTTTSLASTHRLIGVAQEFRSQLPANTTISYRIWLPAGDALDYVQPFVLYYKASACPP
jgi:hypothetical protein